MISPMTMQTPGVPQGLPPQGHGAGDDQSCPFCGQKLPMPYNQNDSPQMQMPQGVMPPQMQGGGDPGMGSALLMALMGGGGMPGGMG